MPAVSSLRLRPTVAASLLALHALGAMAQTPAAEPAASSGTLATVNVEASADASAEGLTKPYAGGQVARGGRVGILGNQDMMSTPFSSTNYTNELIQDQQAKSVADVLLNDPSVRQARGFGNFQELYVVRGFPVFSDDVAYNGLYGMLPRQYIASEFFERVEVFRGANSFLNGAAPGGSGIGGAINLLPKRAPNEPLTRVGFGVQSGGQGFVNLDLARRFGPDDKLGVRVNAVRREGGTGVFKESQQLSAFGVGLDWHSRNVRLSADFGYQDYDLKDGRPSLTPSSTLPIPRVPDAKSNFAQPWTYSKEKDKFATFRGEVDITDNITAWAAGGVRRSDEDNVLSNPTLVNSFGNTSNTRFSNTRKDRIGTAEIGVRGNFTTGPVKHTVVASATTYSNDRDNAYAISSGSVRNNIYAPFFSPYPIANGAGGFVGNRLEDPRLTDKIDTSSVAVADTMSFMEDRLLVTLGARRQTIKQTSFAYNTIKETSAYDKSKTTPVAGVVFKITPTVSAYANYIEALVQGKVAPATANNRPVANGGEVFAPYQAKQKEIGVKYDGGSLGASAAFFTIDQPVYQYADEAAGQVYGLYGKQRNQGLEFSVFGEPTKGLRLLGGLTLLDAKQKNTQGGATDGLTAIGVAKQQLNLGAEWDVAGVRNLSLNARLLYTSKQYANATNTQQIPAWTRVDIGARYLVDLGNGRALTLRARIDNLFNKSYWGSVGGTQGSNYLVMGAPRTFAVSGTIDF
ncbi:iron complex outermembrane receptor protein [Variovorax boronicumulans]|uniref:Iron complex outermembrane receptor protein n=1 Tax=Variovorax boronicumulans TaxID=436515 RepID=A0AAW8D6F7_9BURK|nr:TonB-dependent receptor [Variovorax boronicumulans]MDP9896627.1 iron complex outermembrane receptor protein [Variovorax boronicumulans]MDQ0044062.1 iron complex outermembrane receptor protein [Variovorax boronicumulans]MDQ0056590.1 iron complex outermembrane receptor protein [Variovorax boronicumulans]